MRGRVSLYESRILRLFSCIRIKDYAHSPENNETSERHCKVFNTFRHTLGLIMVYQFMVNEVQYKTEVYQILLIGIYNVTFSHGNLLCNKWQPCHNNNNTPNPTFRSLPICEFRIESILLSLEKGRQSSIYNKNK